MSDAEPVDAGAPASFIASVCAQSRRFETPCGDGTLAWRRWGSGPPLLLLHGGTGSWMHWIHNVLPLSASRSVWVPDMPGYGDSAQPPKGSGVAALASILADGVRRLVSGPVEVAGFSFGGLVSGHLSMAHPGLVRRLVLVGAGGLGLREGTRLPLVGWRHLQDPAAQLAAHRHNLASLMLADPARIDPLALHIQSENARRSQLNSGPFSRGSSLLETLSQLRVPLDGLWGEHDVTVGFRLGEVESILRRSDPHARLHVVENAGHWVAYEQPAQFSTALQRILDAPRSPG